MNGNILGRLALYGGIYALLNVYALLFSNRLIFRPQTPSYIRLPDEVKIESGGGETINAVYLEHPDAKFTILFSHGNAEDMGNVVPFMRQFHELGYSVLMYDYRGYGTSEGSPSERKAKQDVAAAYRWLVEEKQVDPKTIIAQGRSLGGAPATWLAANREVGGLVIESTFVSAFRVKTVWPLLPWDKFNSLSAIKKVKCPVLVMHGRDDAIIPFWHGQKLYDAAPGKKMKLWISDGSHNDYAYVAGADYFDTFQRFSESFSKGTSTPK
ncbi:alpha/beta hydrolase [Pontiella sulfatireligans]|uniref:Multifunctional-autoprocessing repeats-in-toxin n=1 Tax=Pontiella sulfatireligans TaxID=2750658 RepID=A0A6C2ULW0_9BACT|nr:alpha/beta hydrolase [Pontiella sulfatireligans]VGO20294.1 Multifunctional-autoprocessing repeats-in-toxin [Pontiella sulfatireligans]